MPSEADPSLGRDSDVALRNFQAVPYANRYTLASDHSDLTFEEEETLRHYALGAYSYINAHLRGTASRGEEPLPSDFAEITLPSAREIEREVEVIRSALVKSPLVSAVRVSREVAGSWFGVPDRQSGHAAVGVVYEERGFLSTSMTREPPHMVPSDVYPVTLELLVPAGTFARALGDLSYFSDHEVELLIIDGCTIQIDFARYDETADRWRLFGRVE